MTVIGQTFDRWGRAVELTEANWHHAIRRHPEMTSERPVVLATVASPDLVMHDAGYAVRENFYRIVEWNADGTPRRYFKVCVEYAEMGGIIITAFRCRNIKRGERQRWP